MNADLASAVFYFSRRVFCGIYNLWTSFQLPTKQGYLPTLLRRLTRQSKMHQIGKPTAERGTCTSFASEDRVSIERYRAENGNASSSTPTLQKEPHRSLWLAFVFSHASQDSNRSLLCGCGQWRGGSTNRNYLKRNLPSEPRYAIFILRNQNPAYGKNFSQL